MGTEKPTRVTFHLNEKNNTQCLTQAGSCGGNESSSVGDLDVYKTGDK